jgi:ribosomal protein S18 acetylase RimI-like enzyme
MPDTLRMLALAERHPAQSPHGADLPYRLCSDAAHSVEYARLWEDEHGELAAFAVVQDAAFGTLDYLIWPAIVERGVEDELMAWAMGRCQRLTMARGRPLSWWIEAGAEQPERSALAARHGFLRADWHVIHLERSLDKPLAAPQLSDGFALRPLAGPDEVAAYVALHHAAFATRHMTSEWRWRTLELPCHTPALDLVAVAPSGQLVGLCACWPAQAGGRSAWQIEPLGVHPEFQRLGLGHALLAEAFHRVRKRAAAWAVVETYSTLPGALQFYTSVGFQTISTIARYSRDFPGAE